MSEIIFIGIIAVCLVTVIVVFVRMTTGLGKQFKLAKTLTVDIACAGSPVAYTPCAVRIQNLAAQTFSDGTGNMITPKDYIPFIVRGTSMLLCGIQDNDILFTKSIDQLDKISFKRPSVLVLKRDQQALADAVLKNDMAKYKVRRTWAIVRIGEDNVEEQVKQILACDGFKNLQEQYLYAFLSDEDMLDDFKKERITKYMKQYPNSRIQSDANHVAIISTTLRASKGNKVFFSIHPARIIVGKVIYSFHKQQGFVN